MSTPEINNSDDFFRVLQATTAEIDGLVAREPAYPVWRQIQQQLHAMQAWSAGGLTPTVEQQGRVRVGLIATRELAPPPNAAMEDLITRLNLLQYAFNHWPPTGA